MKVLATKIPDRRPTAASIGEAAEFRQGYWKDIGEEPVWECAGFHVGRNPPRNQDWLRSEITVGDGGIHHGAQLAAQRIALDGSTCVMKIMISSSAGSMKNEVVAAPPQLNSPGLPAISVCAGFIVTAKPSPNPMP